MRTEPRALLVCLALFVSGCALFDSGGDPVAVVPPMLTGDWDIAAVDTTGLEFDMSFFLQQDDVQVSGVFTVIGADSAGEIAGTVTEQSVELDMNWLSPCRVTWNATLSVDEAFATMTGFYAGPGCAGLPVSGTLTGSKR